MTWLVSALVFTRQWLKEIHENEGGDKSFSQSFGRPAEFGGDHERSTTSYNDFSQRNRWLLSSEYRNTKHLEW